MRIIDLKLHIDGLRLKDTDTIEDFIKKIEGLSDTNYSIVYEILYEERVDDNS